jgi:hypothetical protein
MMNYHLGEGKREVKHGDRTYTVRFQVQSPPGVWDMVMCKEVSTQGVRFDYPHTIKPETLLSFKINTGLGERPIECFGKVLRCEPAQGSSRVYRVVSQFFDIAKTESYRLDSGTKKSFLNENENPISGRPA